MATSMSVASAHTAITQELRPSFLGLMRGEWLKLSRQWTFWIMLGLMVGGYLLVNLIFGAGGNLGDRINRSPTLTLYTFMEVDLFLLRVFWGMMLIILTARLIGMEYSSGTIRVVLARGVGRLQLLAAKLSVLTLVAIIGAALLEAFALAGNVVAVLATAHNLDVLKSANATFWSDMRAYMLSVLISMLVSLLMAAAVTTVARSLAAGLTASVAWFPLDNFSSLLLLLAGALTNWSFWSLVSGDFLGLNLNAMAGLLLSRPSLAFIHTFEPLTPVTAAHTLLVTAIYAVVFAAVAIFFTVRPDVKE